MRKHQGISAVIIVDMCARNMATPLWDQSVAYQEVFHFHNYINEKTFALQPYFLGMLIAMGLAFLLFLVSYFLGTHLKILEKEKLSLFECGFIPLNDSRQLFFVNFYRISILFILFDIEISYLFPWTTSFFDHLLPIKSYTMDFTLVKPKESHIDSLFLNEFSAFTYYYVVYLFLFLLTIGIVYEYKAKALELNESKS